MPEPPPQTSVVAPTHEWPDAAVILAESDPPRPVGDLKAEVDSFVDVSTCSRERARIDPLVADALTAIGYDAFLLDACRLLEALKKKDARVCEPITASTLRARCQSAVAIVSEKPDGCPFAILGSPESGRDTTCLAAALRDSRLCAGESTTRKKHCEAFVAHDPVICRDASFDRPRCEREASRWRGMFDAPKATKGFAVRFDLDIKKPDGERHVNLDESVERGLVLVEAASEFRATVGEVRELGVVPHASSMQRPRLACRLTFGKVAEGKVLSAHVERCELEVPGATVMQVRDATIGVKRFGRGRGDPIELVLEGEGVQTMNHRFRADIVTYVRDIVPLQASNR